jgi:hypothetical protein
MWLSTWFATPAPSADVPSQSSSRFSCSDLLAMASELAWDEWATFLTMARNHNIDTMTTKSVRSLFAEYRTQSDIVPVCDACSPRQLAEFLYLLSPERWLMFKDFASTVDVNALTFGDLLVQFHTFEYERSRPSV